MMTDMTDPSSTRQDPKLLPPVPSSMSLGGGAGVRRYAHVLASVDVSCDDAAKLRQWADAQMKLGAVVDAAFIATNDPFVTLRVPVPRLAHLVAAVYSAGLEMGDVNLPRTAPEPPPEPGA
jgi:hypothetical protein